MNDVQAAAATPSINGPCGQLEAHLQAQIGGVVFGAQALLRDLAIALVVRGHVLLEGPPGVGKTLIARCLAQLLGGDFRRVQCTADLMPSDLSGVNVWRADAGRFELVKGPLFADVVLADELNRTGPKTQSALLEAMEERRITIDRDTYPLSAEFLVVATQNPQEFEGTFPLPESQLDRFLLRLVVDHAAADAEIEVLRAYDRGDAARERAVDALSSLPAGLLEAARTEAAAVHVSDALYGYVVALAAASRRHPQIAVGLSTRGVLALMRCARVEAALEGAAFVTPDHVKRVAPAVIAHRLTLAPEAALDELTAVALTETLLGNVPVPRDVPGSAHA
jgi:MoxR-like ATPase